MYTMVHYSVQWCIVYAIVYCNPQYIVYTTVYCSVQYCVVYILNVLQCTVVNSVHYSVLRCTVYSVHYRVLQCTVLCSV